MRVKVLYKLAHLTTSKLRDFVVDPTCIIIYHACVTFLRVHYINMRAYIYKLFS